MILAHKIALDPTVAQTVGLAQHAGTARFVYNWGLAECAHVLLQSGNHVMVRRVGPDALDATTLWLHGKHS